MKDLTERRAVYLDDAIEAINKYFARIGKLKRGGLTILERAIKSDTLDAIKALPPAQPERKTGKWLTSDDFYETGICSRCKWDSQEPISYAVTNFNLCPNCGARMVQEGEDNDS